MAEGAAHDVEILVATESTAVTNSTTQPTSTDVSTTTISRKRRRKRERKNPTISQFTISSPPWAYLHLTAIQASDNGRTFDELTTHMQLTTALTQFLGLHGAAISIDILKLDQLDVWIRVPAEDRTVVIAAVGGWVGKGGEGWRVKGWSNWSALAPGRDDGQDLFQD